MIAGEAAWHPLAALTPTAFALAALTEGATAVILGSYRRYAPKPAATLFLASVYASIGAIAFVMLLCNALDPHDGSIPIVGLRAIPYLSFAWKVTLGLSALVYVVLRRVRFAPSRSKLAALALAVPLLCTVFTVSLFSFLDVLPAIAIGATRVAGLYSHVLAPLAALSALIGAVAVLWLPERDSVDRAFAWALIAVAAETATTALTGDRGSAAWFMTRLVYVAGTLWVFGATVRALLDSRARLHDAEAALHEVQSQSQRQAERARAIWQIATNAKENVPARLPLLLEIGRGVLGRGRPAYASLSHLEHGTIEIDAGAGPPICIARVRRTCSRPGHAFRPPVRCRACSMPKAGPRTGTICVRSRAPG